MLVVLFSNSFELILILFSFRTALWILWIDFELRTQWGGEGFLLPRPLEEGEEGLLIV